MAPAQFVRVGRSRCLRWQRVLLKGMFLSLIALGTVGPAGAADDPSRSGGNTVQPKPHEGTVPATPPRDLADLIARVRANEALFRDLDVTVEFASAYRRSKELVEKLAVDRETPDAETVLQQTAEMCHVVTRGDRFHFSSAVVSAIDSGEKQPLGKRVSVFDGADTLAIDFGNSATLFRGRHEPVQFVPPHAWGLFAVEVNFPLSVYLAGTEEVKVHPKVRRYPVEKGSIFELYKVESELTGEERLGSLDCVTVKVRRWYYTNNNPPAIQYLWLAKDRNYHVAQCRVARTRNGQEVPGDTTRVTRWREIAKDVWLPAVVTSQLFRGDAQGDEAAPYMTRNLLLHAATLNPQVPPEQFRLPEIPESLPRFVVDRDGTLEDGPLHPRPAPGAAGTTLATILERLAAEEAKYDRFDVTTIERLAYLSDNAAKEGGGLHMSSESRERSVVLDTRRYYSRQQSVQLASGAGQSSASLEAHDGRWTRRMSRHQIGDAAPQVYASLVVGGRDEVAAFRPHTSVFRGDRNRQSLAQFLKLGWFDANSGDPMAVEYLGDELAGDLHCHKLLCDLSTKGPRTGNHFLLWLARDRNLIAVRHEWREPVWSDRLPTGITAVDDLREMRPGLWFPWHTTFLAFQKFDRDGLSAGRPLLNWRRDIQVESLTFNPTGDDALFSQVAVPEGTEVWMYDNQHESIGKFVQPKTGNIEIGPEQLAAEREQQALAAVIGEIAPALPRDGWLDAEPQSWAGLAGRVVLVEFCDIADETSRGSLKRLGNTLRRSPELAKLDVAIIAVQAAGADREAVAKLAATWNAKFPLAIDAPAPAGSGARGALFDKFAVPRVPRTYLIDRAGKIVASGEQGRMISEALRLARETPGKP